MQSLKAGTVSKAVAMKEVCVLSCSYVGSMGSCAPVLGRIVLPTSHHESPPAEVLISGQTKNPKARTV